MTNAIMPKDAEVKKVKDLPNADHDPKYVKHLYCFMACIATAMEYYPVVKDGLLYNHSIEIRKQIESPLTKRKDSRYIKNKHDKMLKAYKRNLDYFESKCEDILKQLDSNDQDGEVLDIMIDKMTDFLNSNINVITDEQ